MRRDQASRVGTQDHLVASRPVARGEDSAYNGQKDALKAIAPKARDFTNKRAYRNRPLSEQDKETNRRKSSVRAKVERPFLGLKRLWGFAKARYRGMAKNANRAFAMLALLNIHSWGRPSTG